jgi:penicillin-binding protein 1A
VSEPPSNRASRRRRDQGDLLLLAAAVRNRSRRRAPGRRGGRRWWLVLPALLVAGGAIGLAAAAIGPRVLASSCSSTELHPIALGQNSLVYASDGSLLGVIPSVENRQTLRLHEMSRWLPLATVAIEDQRFWHHGALDYRGILRAAWSDLTSGRAVQGGSTITQQLARNLYIGSQQQSLSRKLEEACLAIKLQERLTRREILADYLNVVYYGNHAFGAEAAAETYYSRPASSLTLPQAALIAGLPQAPTTYDPFARPEDARDRRNEVLAALLRQGKIDAAQYGWAVSQPLGLRPGQLYTTIRQPYFFGFVQEQLVSRFGAAAVRSGGLQVKTTIDPRLQTLADRALHAVLRDRRDPAGALVAIDPANGAVKAMAVDIPSGQRLTFNLATQGHRQAGSAFKPFVLATAMQQGISPYASFSGPPSLTIPDRRCMGPNGPWDVHNYADESAGTMDLLNAIAHSVNTIFAQLVVDVGPPNVVATAHRMGITSPLKPVCSITLGSQAVTPLEMADGYATLAARGIHHAPQSLAEVRGPGGAVLPPAGTDGNRALGQNAADLVTYALQGVIQFGTGTAAGFGRPAAGKTGTAESFQDAWFCGYVPQLAACVWVGYPHAEVPLVNVEGLAAVFGGSLPAEIWHDFMAPAVAPLPALGFASPIFQGNTLVPPSAYVSPPPSYSPPPQTTTTSPAPPAPAPHPSPQPAQPPAQHGHGHGKPAPTAAPAPPPTAAPTAQTTPSPALPTPTGTTQVPPRVPTE